MFIFTLTREPIQTPASATDGLFFKSFKTMKRFVPFIFCFLVTVSSAQEHTMRAYIVGDDGSAVLQFPMGIVVIDASAGGREERLRWLDDFFAKNPDHNSVINTLVVMKADARKDLPAGYERFDVRSIVTAPGARGPDRKTRGIKRYHVRSRIVLADIFSTQPKVQRTKAGMVGVVPKITVFASQREKTRQARPAVAAVKVEYGQASFLFTGTTDPRTIAIMPTMQRYKNHVSTLDVDVFQVGSTTPPDLLRAISPTLVVITTSSKQTFPDKAHVDALESAITLTRTTSAVVNVSVNDHPVETTITKAVYCTCWDGEVIISATSGGGYSVEPGR